MHNWEKLILKFRNLGGVADNIIQDEGVNGRGIFAINKEIKTKIFVPENLLVNVKDIFLEKDCLKISNKEKYSKEFIDFFYFYQENFSWGNGGKRETELFEKDLKLFPLNLKNLIKEFTLLDIDKRQEGNWENILKKQFINSRKIQYKNETVIAPIWELINHKVDSYSFIDNKFGISTPNHFQKNIELTIYYGIAGSLFRAINYGFFCEEKIIFSLPFCIELKKSNLQLICRGLDLTEDEMNISINKKTITIDGLPIACSNQKHFINIYFNQLLKKIRINNPPKDLLEKILDFNYQRRVKLLSALKENDSYSSNILSKAINYEVGKISESLLKA